MGKKLTVLNGGIQILREVNAVLLGVGRPSPTTNSHW